MPKIFLKAIFLASNFEKWFSTLSLYSKVVHKIIKLVKLKAQYQFSNGKKSH